MTPAGDCYLEDCQELAQEQSFAEQWARDLVRAHPRFSCLLLAELESRSAGRKATMA